MRRWETCLRRKRRGHSRRRQVLSVRRYPRSLIPHTSRRSRKIICGACSSDGMTYGDANLAVHFEGSQPILRVENMEASVRFYVDLLGFKNAAWGTAEFTSVNRDLAGIYLSCGGQGAGRA